MNEALSTITNALQNDLKASVQFFKKVNKSALKPESETPKIQ